MLLCIKQTNLFKRNITATYNIYLYNSACIKIIFLKIAELQTHFDQFLLAVYLKTDAC